MAGNAAVEHLLGLQRQDAGTATATATATATPADPAADAKALIADTESVKTNKGMATWLMKAHDLGFVDYSSGMGTEDNLKTVKDGHKVGNIDYADTPLLKGMLTMHSLAEARVNRWIADPTKPKQSVTFGSFIRTGADAGRHGTGAAIDINQGDFTGTADDVIALLKDLPTGSYGLGLPFQGDFFPADKKIETMEAAELAKPAPADVTGGLYKFWSSTYKATYNGTTKKYGPPVEEPGTRAEPLLKSDALRTELTAMRTSGSTVLVFPDNDNHLHVDQR